MLSQVQPPSPDPLLLIRPSGVRWPLRRNDRAALVTPGQRLVVRSVALESPGAWAVLGALNPLETIRQYLNDRHERKKDDRYRSREEERQMMLQNAILQNQVISERIQLLREAGATQEEIAAAIWQLVGPSLDRLGQFEQQGMIGPAEIIETGTAE